MMKISKADLQRAADRARNLSTRLAGIKRQAAQVTERVVYSAEVSAAAFTAGVIQGKTGGNNSVAGVPVDLGLGVLLNLGGYLGLAGPKMSDHLHGFGDGFLAAFLSTLGRGVGGKLGRPSDAAVTEQLRDNIGAP
jgi:hypothetical protein